MNDDVLIAVFRRLAIAHECSVDDILVTPELRQLYLGEARVMFENASERDLLHRLVYLRKRSKLPRTKELLSA